MKRPVGAQISHMLKDRGVYTIFGIPGVHNVEMYRGIEEAGITHVLARHEQGAGFMADGYARATGKPGVAYVITGPGLCNIMAPMGQAYSDSVPMLVISSCLEEVAAKKGQLHQMKDQRAAAETVCDWSEEAKTAEAAYQLIDRAFGEFACARPRPKHIQVPISLLQKPVERFEDYTNEPWTSHSQNVVEILKEIIPKYRRPLFILGGGAKRDAGFLGDLVQTLGAACFSTFAGRGIVPADYALNYGSNLLRPSSAREIAKADLVIVVGSDLAETDLWRDDIGATGAVIKINSDPEVLSKRRPNETSYLADIAGTFTQLSLAMASYVSDTEWDEREVQICKTQWRNEVDSERPGIVPIVDALREVTPHNARIYSDMTQFAYVSKEVWPMTRPNMWHHPYGFGTLGYALPAAIGGKIGVGDAPVIAIAGDYGFQYTVQELGVAVELGLSLPIILWDNGKLKEIEDCMVNSQIAPNAVQALNPDFCKLAEAWGALSAHPKSLSEMQEAVKAAFVAAGPTLIYVTPEIVG